MLPRFRRAAALAAVAACGCLVSWAARASPPDSLYARMGGAPVVTAVVSDMVDQAIVDPRLSQSFQGVDSKRLTRQISALFCELMGGGCHYTGDTMRVAHANLHITEAQFDDLVAILRTQMRRHHVGLRERNELLAILAPMKRDIVEIDVPPPPRAH